MKSENGQAVIEVALAIPILMFLLSGIIDFGRILYAKETLNLVSQDAVRYSSLGSADEDVKGYVVSKITDVVRDEITFDRKYEESLKSTFVTISINYNVKIFTPIVSNIFDAIDKTDDNKFRINIKSTIKVE